MLDYVTTVYGYDIANRITSMILQGGTTPKLVRKDTVASQVKKSPPHQGRKSGRALCILR
jgi:hypothetical protein